MGYAVGYKPVQTVSK